MKKVLFAFLISVSFAFVAGASNSVLTTDVKSVSKISSQKSVNYRYTNFAKKIVIDCCCYTSYANDTQSYSGLVCAPNQSAWNTYMDNFIKLLDEMDKVAKIAAN